MSEAYIIDSVRTPRGIGKPGKGALSQMHPQHLAAAVMKALHDRNGFNTADVDDVIWGTSAQKGLQGGDMGRMAALDAGYDIRVSGVTLDRFCGSGLTAVNLAAAQLMSGMEDLLVAGGTEMMSHITAQGMAEREAGLKNPGIGTGNARLQKKHPQSNQGLCADAIATMEGITREELDAFSLESQRRAAHAIENGYFDQSIVPVVDDEGKVVLAKDEHPRPGTTAEGLAALEPSFAALADMPLDKEGNTFRKYINQRYPDVDIKNFHHAGSSSGVVDGAAALLMASESYVQKHGLKPRARIIATANMGDDPTLMLNAPVPAAKKVLAKAGLTKDDIDLWEVNEAFAVVVEKFIRDLDIDRDKINVNGGAIALGHPIGATGAVLIGTVLDELERRNLKRGLITMCAAGGMAPAIIIERV
ncbi:acetyl-CoA C-acyltransferase [Aestuariicella hydrocarbonica]|uniref:Acetyl-CoA C-acyltransferase n=1 Tax=Pseudomaricurvus hydrocarbonicus TaxID=1470433 RepID=A0A9E5MKW7_9GAMM|nr:acetyl-CoA C-acetyltransferase [Aestuariicella hydrocarbonica]NHO65962.1 acetyl-CoA C-acyltransferase [Aestuariicella hydrocarbonica]